MDVQFLGDQRGQGTTTGLTALIAEELDVDLEAMAFEFAPADAERYRNLLFGVQGTGGSTAMANSFMQYRKAGAAARSVLVSAAAETWGVAPSAISIENGVLRAGAQTAHFGEMIARAATLEAPAEPVLKDPSAFRIFGKAGLGRKDSLEKTNGTATFAIDVTVPGMVYAVILRSPRFGGVLKEFDAGAAADVKGFIDAKALPTKTGIVVYATGTWAAMQAREAIEAEWDFTGAEDRSSSAFIAYHRSLLDEPQFQTVEGAEIDQVSRSVDEADEIIEADFTFPNLAHAPMEPLNCVIEPTETGIRLHDGSQFPGGAKPALAYVLQMDPADIEIRTVYAGGSFGRRATPTADYHVEAALAFALMGGATPVKLVWSREDDLHGGFYRPVAVHRARIGVTGGAISAWDHRIATKPIIKGTPLAAMIAPNGMEVDTSSVEGMRHPYYAIPNLSVTLSDAETAMPVLWWRAVGHTHTAYALEVLMDMAAEKAGADPVDFRLGLLEGDGKDQQRLKGVLTLAAEKAGWGSPVPGGFQGVAVHKSFNSYVAQVVEISLVDGAVRIDKVTCAVDCGIAVTPDVIRAQMEGGIGFGLGAIMRNKITMTDGIVDQMNFPDYEPLRISDMPEVDVHIVASEEAPTGVGEPGVPPAGPALANAIFAATGKRVTTLPMVDDGIEFV
ncbi:MAG: xanthine dehydrogenase family protein molybdopterin-binding subunit [Pseudomonadota bacterium]